MTKNKELIYKSDARKAILKDNPSSTYCIDNIKPVDAVEVVHGWWRGETEEEQPHIVLRRVVCSICGGKTDGRYNYCPHCAAKMDLEEEEQ